MKTKKNKNDQINININDYIDDNSITYNKLYLPFIVIGGKKFVVTSDPDASGKFYLRTE